MKQKAYNEGLIKNLSELCPTVRRALSQEGVAPTVERWTPNPTVAGSNPVALIFITPTHLTFIRYSIYPSIIHKI